MPIEVSEKGGKKKTKKQIAILADSGMWSSLSAEWHPSKVFTSGDAVCKYFSIWDFEKENWKVPGPKYPCQCGRNYLWPEHETRRHERKGMGGGRQLARESEHGLSLLQTDRVEHLGFWTSSAKREVPRLGRGWPLESAASHRFGALLFPLSFVSRNFLISLFISLVTFSLFRNVLLNLHVFVSFTAFFSPVIDI